MPTPSVPRTPSTPPAGPSPRRWRVERVRDPEHPLFKPRLRGWVHAVMAPLALAAGIVLVILAPPHLKAACAVYTVTGLLLFAVSATYHLVQWDERVAVVLKRLDHTNIMLVIAGTYTPLSLAMLSPGSARLLLTLVWVGAVAGVAFRVLWIHAPRWLYTPVYVALGLAALLFLGEFFAASVPATVLICAGGAAYIVGAVFYALKAPTIHREWFGFHELFHVCTAAGFVCHFVAIALVVLGAR